jgi:hypothetical protein
MSLSTGDSARCLEPWRSFAPQSVAREVRASEVPKVYDTTLIRGLNKHGESTMAITEYADYDGLGLAELVRNKDVKPAELVEEAISRAEKLNPRLNCVVFQDYDRARATAKGELPKGPFSGVPFFLKDIYADARFMPPIAATHDCLLTARYKAAGFVLLGKTNVSEFGLVPTTESRLYGPARNPWNLEHSPGGSSGGSAAAVAARIVPLAHANDGGGSIRTPASCCGLVGLKPTRANELCTGFRRPRSMRRPGALKAIPIGHPILRARISRLWQRNRNGCASLSPRNAPTEARCIPIAWRQ